MKPLLHHQYPVPEGACPEAELLGHKWAEVAFLPREQRKEKVRWTKLKKHELECPKCIDIWEKGLLK